MYERLDEVSCIGNFQRYHVGITWYVHMITQRGWWELVDVVDLSVLSDDITTNPPLDLLVKLKSEQ